MRAEALVIKDNKLFNFSDLIAQQTQNQFW